MGGEDFKHARALLQWVICQKLQKFFSYEKLRISLFNFQVFTNMAKGKKNLQPIPRAAAPSAPQNAWDDLQQFSKDSAKIMGDAVSSIRDMALNPTLNHQLQQPAKVAELITALGRDMTTYAQLHSDLRARHRDRSGPATSPDEFVEVINIAAEYDELMTSFNNVVLPVVADISLAYLEASENLQVPPADPTDGDTTSTSA
jgi:hypothetical protein